MKLKLERPIVFLDIESTGVDRENDKIIELCLCKVHVDGSKEIKTNRYNPGIPIPPATTEIPTVNVFEAQLEKYEDLPTDISELALYSNYGNPVLDLSGKFTSKDGVILLNFGKYKGQPAAEHTDFLEWMLRANFPPDTNTVVSQILNETEKTF